MGRDLLRRKALALPTLILLAFSPSLRAVADTGADPVPIGGESLAGGVVVHGRPLRGTPPAGAPGVPFVAAPEGTPVRHSRSSEPEFDLPIPERPSIDAWIERYRASRQQELVEALERARLFRRFVSAELQARGLPQELLFLPVLESHYRVRAVSRSGAAGLWQIMTNTSAPLGLRRNLWLDERRDFWVATLAALSKLEENHERFGDWLMALAAYNCGAGCLSRAVRSGGTTDFWELCAKGLLPRETVEYVPKFYAVVCLCAYPDRFGLGPPSEPEPAPAWERIRLERAVELARLAQLAGIPADLLATANAELNFGITPPPSGGYSLKVPADRAQQVRALLADPEAELLRYQLHTVHTGDTFYSLSRIYGVAVEMIQSANPGADPRRLRIGAVLKVPVIGGALREPPALEPVEVAFGGRHTVVSGDTLWSIARAHGTTPELIAAANGRALDDPLRPGETLSVPGGE